MTAARIVLCCRSGDAFAGANHSSRDISLTGVICLVGG